MITDPKVEEYCIQYSNPPSKTHLAMTSSTLQRFPQAARMQVGALEGSFLALMTKLTQAKHVLEFGTFTGYSALAFASGVPENGRVTTLDIDPKATAVAQEHWKQDPHGKKIELILGPALETMIRLAQEIKAGSRARFDLVFIDADKGNYKNYYEASLPLLSDTGAILVDNVLWSGAVLDPQEDSDRAIAAFNQHIKNDSRVEKVMLPIRDGIYLIRPKKGA